MLTETSRLLSGRGLRLHKIPGLMHLYQYAYVKFHPKRKGLVLYEVQGSRMYLNIADTVLVPDLITHGVYCRYETEFFKTLVRPGMVVLDIGANIGYYTLIAARLVGNSGRIYALEPESANFSILQRNVELNNYGNIIVKQEALSNKRGKATLYRDKLNLGGHSFSRKNILPGGKNYASVNTIPLDDFLSREGVRPDFIKIDTQGAEGLVFEGANKTLSQDRLMIFMEFWPMGLRNMGTEPIALLQMLQTHGFAIILIDEKNGDLREMEAKKIVAACGKAGFVNLICKKDPSDHQSLPGDQAVPEKTP